jgi:hypothetical protein
MSYGMICYNCDASIEGKNLAEVDEKAIQGKWALGLTSSGQAYYSCPECASGLFGATALHPLDPPRETPDRASQPETVETGPDLQDISLYFAKGRGDRCGLNSTYLSKDS